MRFYHSIFCIATILLGCNNANNPLNKFDYKKKDNEVVYTITNERKTKIFSSIQGEWHLTNGDKLYDCFRKKEYTITLSENKLNIICNIKSTLNKDDQYPLTEKNVKLECLINGIFILSNEVNTNVIYKLETNNCTTDPQFSPELVGSEIEVYFNGDVFSKIEMSGEPLHR